MMKRPLTAIIKVVDRIISTIGKHIVTQEALAGAYKGIGIEESAEFGIVITGLEVIQLGLGVVYLVGSQNLCKKGLAFLT